MAMPMPPPQPPPPDLGYYQEQQQQQQPQPPPPPPPPTSSQLPRDNYPSTNFNATPNHPPLITPPQYQEHVPHYSDAGSPASGGDVDDSFAFKSPEPFYSKITKSINQRYQILLDASTPHWAARWTFSLVLLLIFMARIVFAQGWYVICYGLSIYYLNLFIGFLSPKIDPAFQADGEFDFDDLGDSDSGPMLPTKSNDEFRPFIRRLPEFKFWLSATKATLISLFLTMFEMFDLPVFWPILLLYFILLFISTMRQQIRHMIKYGYVPWDKGKKRYGAQKEEPSDLFSTTI